MPVMTGGTKRLRFYTTDGAHVVVARPQQGPIGRILRDADNVILFGGCYRLSRQELKDIYKEMKRLEREGTI